MPWPRNGIASASAHELRRPARRDGESDEARRPGRRVRAAAAGWLPPGRSPGRAVGEDDELDDSDDPARLARRLSVRGPGCSPAGLRRPARRLRRHRQAGAGRQVRLVRRHLRRPRRRPVGRTLPVQASAGCVLDPSRRADRFKLSICTYEVPGGLRSHREQITEELIAIYHPSCNPEQYDPSWKDEWIGEYTGADHRPAHHRPRSTERCRDHAVASAQGVTSRPDLAVADAVVQPRPAPAGRRLGRPALGALRPVGRSRRRRSPPPSRTAAAAHPRRHRRCD